MATAAYAVLTHQARAWLAATAAHMFAIASVLVGIMALTAGLGPLTTTNTIYHRTILLVLVADLALFQTPPRTSPWGGADSYHGTRDTGERMLLDLTGPHELM